LYGNYLDVLKLPRKIIRPPKEYSKNNEKIIIIKKNIRV